MPRKATNRIRFLKTYPLQDGRIKYRWEPSPRLRKGGWEAVDLGFDRETAIVASERRTALVDQHDAKMRNGEGLAVPVRAPSIRTISQLIDAYQASGDFTRNIKPKTRAHYRSYMKRIRLWAEDGRTPISAIDRVVVKSLRDTLVAHSTPHITAAQMSVLGVLLQYAVDMGLLAANPAHKQKVPQPTPRRTIARPTAIELLIDTANKNKMPNMALALVLGFWTMQREGDLLSLTVSAWRALPREDVPPEAVAALVAPDGHIWGFEKRQAKTDEPIYAPVPHDVRRMVKEAILRNRAARPTDPASASAGATINAPVRIIPAATFNIITDDRMPGRAYSEKNFQRRFAEVRSLAIETAMERQDHDLADHLAGLQFRDFRRTGMCYFGELRVPVQLIASISGHSIDYTQKILDTYMPRNSRFAIMAVAEAVQRAAARAAIIEEQQA